MQSNLIRLMAPVFAGASLLALTGCAEEPPPLRSTTTVIQTPAPGTMSTTAQPMPVPTPPPATTTSTTTTTTRY